jgi:hypothetical protein
MAHNDDMIPIDVRLPFQARAWVPLFEIDFCGIYRLTFDVSENSYYLIWDLMNMVVWGDKSEAYKNKK